MSQRVLWVDCQQHLHEILRTVQICRFSQQPVPDDLSQRRQPVRVALRPEVRGQLFGRGQGFPLRRHQYQKMHRALHCWEVRGSFKQDLRE